MFLLIGISFGLFFGKLIGVFGVIFLLVKLGVVCLLYLVNWVYIVGVVCLVGIGFIMLLFIGGLSFGDNLILMNEVCVGVLSGLIVVVIVGYIVLWMVLIKDKVEEDCVVL